MNGFKSITFEGAEYFWDGNNWYGSNFVSVPSVKIPTLNSLIPNDAKQAFLKEMKEEKYRNRIDAHKIFLEEVNIPYEGVRIVQNSYHRVTHCYRCKRHLDNLENHECCACGWIICDCGACGCGYGR